MPGSDYYDHRTFPSHGSAGSSSGMRSELGDIEAGFGKLPDLTVANAGLPVFVNDLGTAQEALTADSARSKLGTGTNLWCGTAGGTANALALTPTPAVTAYVAGQRFLFKSGAAANTTSVIFAVSGLPSIAAQVNGAALAGGEIAANNWYEIVVDASLTSGQLSKIGRATLAELGAAASGPLAGSGITGAAASGANTDITSLSALASINGGPLAGLKNVLINPEFLHDQRNVGASTAIADDTYCFDRWYALTQTGTVAASQLSDPENGYTKALRLTQSQAVAQRFGIAQIVEGKYCKHMRGGTSTLVPRIRCSSSQALRYAILEWTGTEDAVTSDVVLDWTSASYTAGGFFLAANLTISAVGTVTLTAATWTSLTKISPTLGSAFNNLVVMVWTEGTAAQNVTLDFDYAQLEQGTVATAPERRAPLELDLCRRYLPAFNSSAANSIIANGMCGSTTNAYCDFIFNVTPRVAPTGITNSTASQFSVWNSGTVPIACTGLAFSSASTQGCTLNPSVASGLVAGDATRLFANSATATQILFTGCEL